MALTKEGELFSQFWLVYKKYSSDLPLNDSSWESLISDLDKIITAYPDGKDEIISRNMAVAILGIFSEYARGFSSGCLVRIDGGVMQTKILRTHP